MNFSQHMRGWVKAIAIVLSLALPVLAASTADARVGGGFSSGSRGTRTFTAPPSTNTAPSAAQPFNRTFSQPSSPGINSPAGGGFFNRPGRGLLGGFAAGFLGAGLLGMLFGGGLFSGIGGFSSILGLLLQVVLIVFLVRMAMSWWQRRQMSQPAYAGPAGGLGDTSNSNFGGMGFGLGSSSAPLQIQPADYEAFERLLVDMQAAYSNEDVAGLRALATPEMVSFFTQDMQQNRARGQVNKVSDTHLLQGDLAEAWREGDSDYASVAMRFSMIDKYVDINSGRLVSGSEQPVEVTEVWTFVRRRGSNWMLSAIQQTN
jgi:predicted lipid-binding transport protein (Tim44 family)